MYRTHQKSHSLTCRVPLHVRALVALYTAVAVHVNNLLVIALVQGWAELADGILAYKFRYPTRTTSGKKLSMVLSHPPEK